MNSFDQARQLLREFKGDRYAHGFGVLERTGEMAAPLGKRAVLVRSGFSSSNEAVDRVLASLSAASVTVAGVVKGAAPNAPLEDLRRITDELIRLNPDVIVSFGGGSTIDCVKAAEVLRTLGGSIEDYFGTGLVTKRLAETGRKLTPHIAIQSAASSAAHLTKYSNITDLSAGQKKLIVDDAVVPPFAVFDYGVTLSAPPALTADGAFDGLSHSLEVFYGATGKANYELVERVARTAIGLVMHYLPVLVREPANREAREALGLATDLGGYAIMIGGTNGGHLTSFSLIDILSHGRACVLMNPYYTVFYSPAIQPQLRTVASLAEEAGFAPAGTATKTGEALAKSVAEALMTLERAVHNPTRLADVPGFTHAHLDRALTAAKNPQLRMKLENMPVPLTPELVDRYMAPVLEAAADGDLGKVVQYHAVAG